MQNLGRSSSSEPAKESDKGKAIMVDEEASKTKVTISRPRKSPQKIKEQAKGEQAAAESKQKRTKVPAKRVLQKEATKEETKKAKLDLPHIKACASKPTDKK
ncbi:hypothetical protein PanWU01x14_349340 [Parasponia andersonii]|uniref:Uncharacterized protein n=1 Tax=Parasponia andersonii TaxID=3476 RepID=A0A2P5ABB6_PARAD|nr:hypothetical protein PanWU01x14_349340 [Parasponia andersonii]